MECIGRSPCQAIAANCVGMWPEGHGRPTKDCVAYVRSNEIGVSSEGATCRCMRLADRMVSPVVATPGRFRRAGRNRAIGSGRRRGRTRSAHLVARSLRMGMRVRRLANREPGVGLSSKGVDCRVRCSRPHAWMRVVPAIDRRLGRLMRPAPVTRGTRWVSERGLPCGKNSKSSRCAAT